MSIRQWPQRERPREKLLERGPGVLTEAELLAILLRTGVRGQSALDVARSLLLEFGSLRGLLTTDRERLCGARGLGPAGGRYLLLGTASLSALGYDHNASEPAIRFWNDTRHVGD